MDCYACAPNDSLESLPARELIGIDAYWRVAHAFDTALPGWLVLVPRRHVTAVADLTDAESAGLGAWQVRLSRALHAETRASHPAILTSYRCHGDRNQSRSSRS